MQMYSITTIKNCTVRGHGRQVFRDKVNTF
ncbi:UNVERIFIED_ORG: hypothetical protein FHW05_004786 [Pantoea agglomerans]